MKRLLNDKAFPQKLKSMTEHELELLSYEIRQLLLDTVSVTGGHLSSNLGVVELTIALHTVFDTPKDKIIWDVGHQAYVHKILTGRSDKMCTLRTHGGISGFPRLEESVHDMYASGHSSTSISAALGYAAARDLNHDNYSVVAVIGDGALTGGIAYEALNNAGQSDRPMIVILNDNEMSISKNVGGMSQYLGKLRASHTYLEFKKKVKHAVKGIPKYGEGLYSGMEHIRDSVKYAVVSGAIFEEFGFKYFGPIDGHNIHDLIQAMQSAKGMQQPVLLHVVTKKGKGYRNAEKNPGKFHGIGAFDLNTGELISVTKNDSYSQIFGKKMLQIAQKDSHVVAISAAMVEATGLGRFQARFPNRLFDVGIAEQHAVSFAAGLALNGMKPVVAIYSTFLQRAYDQILIDVCMQNLPVIFAIDRAGNVGNDGETHNGQFDLSYLLHMPNLTIMAPKDGKELEDMLEYAFTLNSPCAIRYPRGEAERLIAENDNSLQIDGKIEALSEGKDGTLLAVGKMVGPALEAKELLQMKGFDFGVVNIRFVKPLDEDGILSCIHSKKTIVTLEDNTVIGGFGSIICQLLEKEGESSQQLLQIGWPDEFISQGKVSELMKDYQLDANGITERVAEFIEG
ncbi:1-deoxy-D-xylulose-5-phosphate synthase [Sinanaerobacter sp. ZZT-01]|uniref:1-deoxy-D-xylulose-5-phosphate synthase n=1 Tax=Sinanaerobacter sp. ZZT-01 TaxID=3111540 RepID=UPI002D78246B|nr:1-deoxy-D-xylulose-5-phosphate synthase [Sinanaerobacter sp. ZZT-01]WRR93123.1 1-deoxy-D-xylulose-5-phosphate synthase [Sinanaerobacter sp. ZZT-01]